MRPSAAGGVVRPRSLAEAQREDENWRNVVQRRELSRDEQRDLVEALGRVEAQRDTADAESDRAARQLQDEERRRTDAVRISMAPLPLYSRYQRCRNVRLNRHDPVREYLVSELARTATGHEWPAGVEREAPQFDVLYVEKIENPRLQQSYLAELDDIAGLCNQRPSRLQVNAQPVKTVELDLNEYFLYHGAPADLKDRYLMLMQCPRVTVLCGRICLQGLDPRYGGSNAGRMFGYGTYFAANSSKSDIYARPSEQDERYIFVVRVCLGEAHQEVYPVTQRAAIQEWRMPPERPDARGPLTSVVGLTVEEGGALRHPEYITYDRRQALPQWVIKYRHKASCFCSVCVSSGNLLVTHEITKERIKVHVPGLEQTQSPSTELVNRICTALQMHPGCVLLRHATRGVISADTPVYSGDSLSLSPHNSVSAPILTGLPTNHMVSITIMLRPMGDGCSVSISLDATFAQLKATIQYQTGVAAELQRKFIFLGRELAEDQAQLRSPGVVNGSTLHAIIKPRVYAEF